MTTPNTPEATPASAQPAPVEPHTFTNKDGEVLILRRCEKSRKSKNGFTYPTGLGSVVEAPDWNPNNACGGGLHGWPWGFGLGEGSDFDIDDVWLVLGAKPEDVSGKLEGGLKCKCRRAQLRYDGDMPGAIAFLSEGFAECVKAMCQSAQSGHNSQSAQSGHNSQSAQSGDYSKSAQSGDYSKSAQSGHNSKSAQSGDNSQSAQSGHNSQSAQSGHNSKSAQSGDNSVAAIAATGGLAKTGKRGCFALAYWTEETGWEFAVGKVGRDGIKAETWYEVRDGKLVEVA